MGSYALAPVYNALGYYTSTQVGYLADSDDGTTVQASTVRRYVDLGLPTSPVGELVAITVAARELNPGNYNLSSLVGLARNAAGSWTIGPYITWTLPGGTPLTWYDSPAMSAAQGSIALWGLTDVADAWVWIQNGGALTVSKLSGTAYYLPAATVAAPSAPTGTVTEQKPAQTVTVSAVVESWQGDWLTGVSVEMQVFASADAPGGDPPEGVTPVWSTVARADVSTYGNGSTPTTAAVSVIPDVFFGNGEFVTYARVSRDLPAGEGLYWSAWSKSASAWTVDVADPAAPTAVTAVADDVAGSVAITVAIPHSAGYDDDSALVSVERSDDVGLTWTPVYGMTRVEAELGTSVAMGVDYLAPAAHSDVQYRARVSAELTEGGLRVSSEWTVETAVTTPIAYEGWRFLSLDDPTASLAGAGVLAPTAYTLARVSQVFEPLDGSYAKVVSGPSRGRRGTLAFHASTSAERTALAALLAQTGPIIMTTGFGDTIVIALVGEPTFEVTGGRSAPVTAASIGFVETELPA